MNDFTKEELDEIFWILEGCTMDYIGKENNVLIDKIQSMIDNYCEHKPEPIEQEYMLYQMPKNAFMKQIDDCVRESFLGYQDFIEKNESDEFKAGLLLGQYIASLNCKIVHLESKTAFLEKRVLNESNQS